MRGFYSRLFIAFAVLLFILLTGLGVVLGQFFHIVDIKADAIVQRKYSLYLFVLIVVTYIISLFFAARIIKHFTKPIDSVAETAEKIASGDYLARTPLVQDAQQDRLALSINQIARNLHEMSIMRGMEKERLKTLIESMGSGLLMFGREGSVNLLNGVFENTFGYTKDELIGKPFKDIGLPTNIEKIIEDVFLTEEAQEKQVKHGQTFLSVYGAPVIGKHGNWLGIIVVLHDITELIRLEEVRKDFVANVSHELRTPITSIKGFTETLLDGAMAEQNVLKEFLEIIQKESNRLQLLVDDLLELSGIEREGFDLHISKVTVAEVIQDAINIVSGKLIRKDMSIEMNDFSQITFEVDRDRLIQVMVNLLSNAINYSKEHTTIRINITESDREVIIEVKDEGIGIKQDELPRLFERFYRVDRARSRESGGTGLGLAIVKHLIEAHGGHVAVESEIGVGTSFFIVLPKGSEK
ncbi:two-component system histidine kinase PnpS [Sporosarcina contaminans]|uniref:histidine kinase n=1 Tax=Sporosarcina contaminans TaxID=633403 RepID=A0ABW3U2R3_9BACL